MHTTSRKAEIFIKSEYYALYNFITRLLTNIFKETKRAGSLQGEAEQLRARNGGEPRRGCSRCRLPHTNFQQHSVTTNKRKNRRPLLCDSCEGEERL